MNWRELKVFCNQLADAELDKKVILWREEEAITDISSMQLEGDYYKDPKDSMSGCFPESEVDDVVGLKKVYDKGTPILHENF